MDNTKEIPTSACGENLRDDSQGYQLNVKETATNKNKNKNKCGDDNNVNTPSQQDRESYLTALPPEVIQLIFRHCDVVALISLSKTCRKLYDISMSYEMKWKSLCEEDFDVRLTSKGKFSRFYDVYRLLYCSRILLGSYIYARYYGRLKMVQIPHWLLVWAALSRHPPIMKYGKERIGRRINGSYLKRLNDISQGQLRSAFNLNTYDDLMNLYPSRMEKGTFYFSWLAVKYAGIRKYFNLNNYMEFLLNKCYRARGFIERNYEKLRGTNPLVPL